jgi:hypothetical protein
MNNLRTYKNTKKKYTGPPKMKPEIEENPTKKRPLMEKGTEYQYALSPNLILMIPKWIYKKGKKNTNTKAMKIPNKRRVHNEKTETQH